MPSPLNLLGLGCVSVDELLTVAGFPQKDGKVRILKREKRLGGQTGNALVAAARFGVKSSYAGILGINEPSQFVLDSFAREGIDSSHVFREEAVQPIRCTILIGTEDGSRTVFYDLENTSPAPIESPPEQVIQSSQVLYVDHYGVEGMLRAALIARKAGIPIVADFEFPGQGPFAELISLVDHLVLSLSFARDWTGKINPEVVARELWQENRQVVIVTAGEQGFWYLEKKHPDHAHHQGAYLVKARDTTGCGDVFRGVYAATLSLGLNLKDRLRMANSAAALKARNGVIPYRNEIAAFMTDNP